MRKHTIALSDLIDARAEHQMISTMLISSSVGNTRKRLSINVHIVTKKVTYEVRVHTTPKREAEDVVTEFDSIEEALDAYNEAI